RLVRHPTPFPYTTLFRSGYYREVFRSDLSVPFQGAPRSAGTSIYYLLAQGACSAWHRIDADETWYFHAGGPLALHVLSPEGGLADRKSTRLNSSHVKISY